MVHVGPLPERKTGCQIALWRDGVGVSVFACAVCMKVNFKKTALWQTHKYDLDNHKISKLQ